MATGRVPTTANSPLTAKGDLFGYSTTQARVPVGSDGETLVADSSATTGLRWTATPSASNPVINSAFQIWQRGTSFSYAANAAGAYTADRWYNRNTGGPVTISRQLTNDTTNLPFIQYCLRYQRDSGSTSTAPNYFTQSFETVNSIPFAGKTVTFSFYARKGANLSGSLTAQLFYGTGTDQNIQVSYTGITAVTSNNIASSITTTWQRFSFTGSVASTATELAINFDHTPSGTAGAADYYEITGLQIDVGSVALPFRTYAATLAGELAACQRYYWRQTANTSYTRYGTGIFLNTTDSRISVTNPVPMRVAPTSMDYSTLATYDSAVNAVTSLTLDAAGQLVNALNGVSSGGAQYRPLILLANASTSAYLGFSAEL